jgi:hypothetical protein
MIILFVFQAVSLPSDKRIQFQIYIVRPVQEFAEALEILHSFKRKRCIG